MKNHISLMHRVVKKIWIVAAVLIILAAVFSSIFRTLTPWAKQYKGEVEHRLSELLHQPVSVQTMEIGWYWFQPVLKLKDLTLGGEGTKTIHLEKLLVGVHLFNSLIHRQIQPGLLYADTMHVVVYQKKEGWQIEGFSNWVKNNNADLQKPQAILFWLSQQDRVILKNISVSMHLKNKQLIPLKLINLSVVSNGDFYKLKGDARLEQAPATELQLLGNIHFDPTNLQKTTGQLFASLRNVQPAQWQNVLPLSWQMLKAGTGTGSLWVDLENGGVSLLQAQLAFNHLVWRTPYNNNNQEMRSLSANIAWKPQRDGWQFHADGIKLTTKDVVWPENQCSLTFNKAQKSYRFFAKKILIESLLNQPVHWPEALHKVLAIKPQGLLTDTQFIIKEGALQYLVTRFDQLGWQAKDKLPEVHNLAGVLNWQPDEGRLELDTDHARIAAVGYPKLDNILLNGSFDWKELSHGVRVSIERLVLSQSQFTLSIQGTLDELRRNSMGMVHLTTDFSGKNIQQWLPYLPKSYLKPKLYHWLVKDLKRIEDLNGTMIIKGLAKEFPFDNNTGEFAIKAHASGADVLINSKWQLVKDIEAFIKVNHRNLDVDIVHANAQGVPINQLNLRIDDIGHDKENLLMHTIIDGSAQKMINYVLASPMNNHLSVLKKLKAEGSFLLNLRLEVPLYPENDKLLAQGDLTFKDNNIVIQHQAFALPLEDVAGTLNFNDQGIQASNLVATAFSYPWNIKIESLKTPEPMTTIAVEGLWAIETLKNRLNLPILSLFKGMFYVHSLFKITNNPDTLDNLNVKSTLKGLAINVPHPLGKVLDDIAPLEVNVDFNAKNDLRLKINYKDSLSTDILFQDKDGAMDLKSGEIRLGNAHAKDQDKPGLALVGNLEGFDVQAWKKIINKYSIQQSDTSLLRYVRIIDVTMGKFTFLKQQWDKLIIKAKILANHDFSFNIQQEKVSADLMYHSQTHALSGYVHYLHLAKMDAQANRSSTPIQPEKIPNLNLRIDNLEIGTLKIGDVTLKTHSTPQLLKIDYCRVNSPVYQFDIKGDWLVKDKYNQSKVEVKLHLTDLAKSLERWQITPVVYADKGDMQFNGGWDGSLYNFSLASLHGLMYLQLKNGRITHLSPETEEKLGLGKLLSVLSLQTIPRRLTLDFSDLSHQGYSFDVFKGTFTIKKGIMNTQDSYIDGPVAYASMKGDLNLVKRMYDLDLIISPHITASLPIVATIAGGPVVGIAAWVANKIINQSMQKITAYTYKISGPWKQPIVHQLTIVKKVEKK